MADIIIDKYKLNYSPDFNISGVEEKTVDVNVDTSDTGYSVVLGSVTDTNGNPLPDVTIKLFDANMTPYKHVITSSSGKYSFPNLASGSYFITAVKDGCVITVPTNFFIQENETQTFDFVMKEDESLKLCAIAGHVIDEDRKPIPGAILSLMDESKQFTISTTQSADDGEYIFYDIQEGNYKLIVVKDGYSDIDGTSLNARDNSVVNLDVTLLKDPIQNVGTISGVVTNNGAKVANAFVGLYKMIVVNDGGMTREVETLVSITKTNSNGIYMFGNVVEGDYKVKSKLNKTTTTRVVQA